MVGRSAVGGMGGLEIGPLSLGNHRPSHTQNFVGAVVEAHLRELFCFFCCMRFLGGYCVG